MLTVSWLRAYHSPMLGPVRDTVQRLADSGFLEVVDDQAAGVFDIQAVRLGHLATSYGPDVAVRGPDEEGLAGTWTGRTHLLFHASGFIVVRLTLSTTDNPDLTHGNHALLRAFERLPWGPAEFTWTVGNASVVGNVRACLNTVFLQLLEALPGSDSCDDLSQAVQEGPDGWEHLHELCGHGRLSHPYPVSFGTQIEVADSELVHDAEGQQAFLRAVVLPGIGVTWEPRDVEADASDVSWYFLENQSVVFRPEPTAGGRAMIDDTRTGLLDYLTLRRGALRSVQRDTQRVISGRLSVSRRRLQEWQLLVQSTTDDYVLSDRTGQILALLRARLGEQSRVRDPDALEAQVRSNLESFTTALDQTAGRITAAVGTLFAVLAATAVVGAPLQLAVDYFGDGIAAVPYDELHPLRAAALQLTVAGVAAVLFLLLLRVLGGRLRAPRLQRGPPRRPRQQP